MKNKPEKVDQNRLLILDLFRIVACLLVTGVHVSSTWIYDYSVGSFGFKCAMFWNAVSSAGPMLFFMLSGMVMLDNTRPDIPISRLWYRNILRLILAYTIWSCIYTGHAWWGHYPFNSETIRLFIDEFFVGGTMYHMWFIPALVPIYVVLPIIRPALKDVKNCRYFIICYVLISYLVPGVLNLNLAKGYMLEAALAKFSFISFGLYAFMFVLGWYLRAEKIVLPVRTAVYTAGVIMFVNAFRGGINRSVEESAVYLGNWSATGFSNVVYLAAFALVFVSLQKRFGPGAVFKGKLEFLNRLIPELSKLTFGIYLIHPMFLGATTRLLERIYLPGLVRIPLQSLILFAISAPFIWVLSKIPVLKRYMV